MQTTQSFDDILAHSRPSTLTIGAFDGIHLGHQAILNKVRDIAKKENKESAIVTFKNHPSEILRPDKPIKPLCTLSHKTRLIEKLDIDYMMLLPFTERLAALTAEEFVLRIRAIYPFSHLILGHDAAFGKDRHGDHLTVKKLADKLKFTVEYLPQLKVDGTTVSSSRIRNYLEHGDLHAANKLLGRKYSIYSNIVAGSQNGRAIGFPTANVNVAGLCLPPFGVYAVNVIHGEGKHAGIANLGVAPTIKKNAAPQLEVHLFQYHDVLNQEEIEVEFVAHIRPEKKFKNIHTLQQQIVKDIHSAKELIAHSC